MAIQFKKLVILLIIGSLLISCSPREPVNPTPVLSEFGYPIITGENDPSIGYPVQEITQSKINPLEIKNFPQVPDPEPGLGSMSGILYSPVLSQIIPNNAFYLMPAIGENNSVPPIIAGPDPEQGDIHGFSDEKGWIILNNIKPDLYFLVVWSPYDWLLAEDEDQKPLLIEIFEDSKNPLNIISIPWQ